jgi:RNA polymerase sigma factor (sigma-70 family)
MAHATSKPVLRYIVHALAPADSGLSDAGLLERFAAHGDEAAFAALVRRHGPAVLGVCLRVLRHRQDAEDAFQAAFLVLARRAHAIRKRESVASWLHGVALRVARKARAGNLRRREWPGELPDRPAPEATPAFLWRDLRPVLDEEIGTLPEKYRAAFVLCYLEGKTNEEAADLLGCPKGTILSRLARARERLAHGLTRRGVSLPAGALAGLLAAEALQAAAPAALTAATARAAVSFAAGRGAPSAAHSLALKGLQAMRMTWVGKALAVTVALGATGAGAGILVPRGAAPGATEARAEAPPEVKKLPGPPPPAREPERKPESRLEAVLCDWAKASDAVRETHYKFTQTTKDKTFDRTEVRRGEVFFKKPDLLRVNVVDEKGKPTEVLLWEKRALHLLNFKERNETIAPLPPDFPYQGRPNPSPKTFWGRFALLSDLGPIVWPFAGFPVRQLETRFDLRLAKEDQYYSYLDLTPRTPADKAFFQRARVVLNRDGLWVRQLWFENPNNSDVTYDYEKPNTAPVPPITRDLLLKGLKNLPPGWKRLDGREKAQPPPPEPPK